MKSPLREPRRPNLATIVGSGLAVAAAGSLLAFSSLAEQAGLQGLAAGGLQPAVPGRGSGTRPITIPAPAAPPNEPATPDDTLRDLVARVVSEAPPAPRVAPSPPPETPRERRVPQEERPSRPERRTDPAFAARGVTPAAPDDAEYYGPPYGKAKGHHKHDKPAKRKPSRKQEGARWQEASAPPVYAKSKASGGKKWKAPKMKKVTKESAAHHGKAKGHDDRAGGRGKANGHAKHATRRGKSKGHDGHGKAKGHDGHGKAKGHAKHAGGRGKGKGHSKNGH